MNGCDAHDECDNIWDVNLISGNYWEHYTGIDSDQDGIGDILYRIPGGSSVDKYPLISPWIESENQPPEKPSTPSGPTSRLRKGEEYIYETSVVDPELDPVWFYWDWGDGTESNWTGPFNSGKKINFTHIWENVGTYEIRVKSRDVYNKESVWSDPLTVTLPKDKETYLFLMWLERIMKWNPIINIIIQPIYRIIMNL
jgi:hypothetical protein